MANISKVIFSLALQNSYPIVGFIFLIIAILSCGLPKQCLYVGYQSRTAKILSKLLELKVLIIPSILAILVMFIADITITIRTSQVPFSQYSTSQMVFRIVVNQAFAEDTKITQQIHMRQRDVRQINLDKFNDIYIYAGDVGLFHRTRIVIFRSLPGTSIPRKDDEVYYKSLEELEKKRSIKSICDKQADVGDDFSPCNNKDSDHEKKISFKITKKSVSLLGQDYIDVEIYNVP